MLLVLMPMMPDISRVLVVRRSESMIASPMFFLPIDTFLEQRGQLTKLGHMQQLQVELPDELISLIPMSHRVISDSE